MAQQETVRTWKPYQREADLGTPEVRSAKQRAVTIDGVDVRVPEGTTVMRAAAIAGANVVTTDNSDWATNCPEYKVTAVQAYPVTHPSEWQQRFSAFDKKQKDLLRKAHQHDYATTD